MNKKQALHFFLKEKKYTEFFLLIIGVVSLIQVENDTNFLLSGIFFASAITLFFCNFSNQSYLAKKIEVTLLFNGFTLILLPHLWSWFTDQKFENDTSTLLIMTFILLPVFSAITLLISYFRINPNLLKLGVMLQLIFCYFLIGIIYYSIIKY